MDEIWLKDNDRRKFIIILNYNKYIYDVYYNTYKNIKNYEYRRHHAVHDDEHIII